MIPTPARPAAERDEFGIITRNAQLRALYGNRVTHGKARHIEALPEAATVNPFVVDPQIKSVIPPIISDDIMRRAEKLEAGAAEVGRRLQAASALATEIEEAAQLAATGAASRRVVELGVILAAVASAFGVAEVEICGPGRTRTVTRPRFAFCRLAQRHAGASSTRLGYFLGNRDHTSVLNAWTRAEKWMAEDEDWRSKYDAAELLVTMHG